jgi:negative regulator of sigma E activity
MTERTHVDNADPNDRLTEPAHDQLSAFLDDELSEEETAFLVRRFERDPDVRSQLVRYATIGSALRGELFRPNPNILRRRVAAALNGAQPQPQPQRVPAARPWRGQVVGPLVRVGIAAAVAIAAVVALRSVNDLRSAPAAAETGTPVQVRQWTEPPSYVVPQDALESGPVRAPIRLTNYLMHHGEYASRLSRTSVHSNVVGASDSPAQRANQNQDSLE